MTHMDGIVRVWRCESSDAETWCDVLVPYIKKLQKLLERQLTCLNKWNVFVWWGCCCSTLYVLW